MNSFCLEHPAQQKEALADCPFDGSERMFRKAFAVVHLPLVHVDLEPDEVPFACLGDHLLQCHSGDVGVGLFPVAHRDLLHGCVRKDALKAVRPRVTCIF